jgi:general secretion pathway protein I
VNGVSPCACRRSKHRPLTISHQPCPSRAGFTLIEVLVATAVLAVGISAGVRALGAMTRASAAAQDRATAVRLAGERLAVLEAAVDATPGTLDVELTDAQGQFDADPRFRWQQQVATASDPDLLDVTVTVSWGNGRSEHRYLVTTYLPTPPATDDTTQTGTGTG